MYLMQDMPKQRERGGKRERERGETDRGKEREGAMPNTMIGVSLRNKEERDGNRVNEK